MHQILSPFLDYIFPPFLDDGQRLSDLLRSLTQASNHPTSVAPSPILSHRHQHDKCTHHSTSTRQYPYHSQHITHNTNVDTLRQYCTWCVWSHRRPLSPPPTRQAHPIAPRLSKITSTGNGGVTCQVESAKSLREPKQIWLLNSPSDLRSRDRHCERHE